MKKILIATAVLGSLVLGTVFPTASTQQVLASERAPASVYTYCIKCGKDMRFIPTHTPGEYECISGCGATIWR